MKQKEQPAVNLASRKLIYAISAVILDLLAVFVPQVPDELRLSIVGAVTALAFALISAHAWQKGKRIDQASAEDYVDKATRPVMWCSKESQAKDNPDVH